MSCFRLYGRKPSGIRFIGMDERQCGVSIFVWKLGKDAANVCNSQRAARQKKKAPCGGGHLRQTVRQYSRRRPVVLPVTGSDAARKNSIFHTNLAAAPRAFLKTKNARFFGRSRLKIRLFGKSLNNQECKRKPAQGFFRRSAVRVLKFIRPISEQR